MANEHITRCSASLVIREMQIEITMKYHFIPTRMAIIKNMDNGKYWRGCGEIKVLLCHWRERRTARRFGKQFSIFSKSQTQS